MGTSKSGNNPAWQGQASRSLEMYRDNNIYWNVQKDAAHMERNWINLGCISGKQLISQSE